MRYLRDIKSHLLQALPNDGTKVALALNCWSANDHKSFMAIMAYFINTQWNYHEVMLGFEPLQGQHSGENLAGVLNNVIIKHELSD